MNASGSGYEGDGEVFRRPARTPPLPLDGERTALWTHYLCHLVRLIFLFSHGLLVVVVSFSLDRVGQTSWYLLFSPAWIGDLVCCGLVVFSWFASCPYIKLCHREGKIRVGVYPSFLTEVLPEIVLSIVGLVFLLFIFVGEYFFCTFLESSAEGRPHGIVAAAVLFTIVSILSVCHGTLFTHNSPLYLAAGTALFATGVIFLATRHGAPQDKAWVLAPPFAAVLVVLLASLNRLYRHRDLLGLEEKVLRFSEAVLLLALLTATGSVMLKTGSLLLHEANIVGMVAGTALCLIALVRGRLCWWEAWEGTLEERVISEVAVPAEGNMDLDDDFIELSDAIERSMAATNQDVRLPPILS